MEIVQEFSNQYMLYIPVALVIVGAILVFTFGFKSAEQPPFDKLSSEDRKSAAGKKRKLKEKKSTANGHVVTAGESKSEKSPSKKSPAKETEKQDKKDKKVDKQLEKVKKSKDQIKAPVIKEETKENKKSLKKLLSEKPTDFDEGDWEIVPSKADKKKKGDQSPTKKEKRPKKNEKVDKSSSEKVAKENEVTELLERENEASEIEEIAEESNKIEEQLKAQEPVAVVEERKEKKKKEKKGKKDSNSGLGPDVKEASPSVIQQPKEEKVVEKTESPKKNEVTGAPKTEDKKTATPVFDELGDVWTEAKAPKKTAKKKARRDN